MIKAGKSNSNRRAKEQATLHLGRSTFENSNGQYAYQEDLLEQ